MAKRYILMLIGITPLVMLAGCRESQKATPTSSIRDIEIHLEAESLTIGETTLSLSVMAGDHPVTVDKLTIRGDMDHAGMSPVIREIEGEDDGQYTVPFEWTMAGDWYVEVNATLLDGEQFLQRFELTIESYNDDDIDMGSGAVTASYMIITNNGEDDDALVSAETQAATTVEIHQTMMENEVMRMMPAEDTSIPAGGALTMEPGGIHLMLINLQQDLKVDETITLTLTFESGTEAEIEAVIQDLPPEDIVITEGNITIENAWVRPMNQ